MSRSFFGAVSCLLAVFGLMIGAHLSAQEGSDPSGDIRSAGAASQSEASTPSAEERIDAALDKQLKAPLEYFDTPLTQVITQLQDEYEIPIVVDIAALDELAISPETEITASLRNIRLNSALDLMFKQPGLEDLTYIIDDEVLLITTEERANETIVVKVYRVDDFEQFDYDDKEDSKKSALCYSPVPLIKAIVNSVEFDSWQANGTGEGALFLMKPGMLVVAQTRAAHRKIEEFLDKLRAVKAEIENDSSGSSRSGSGRF